MIEEEVLENSAYMSFICEHSLDESLRGGVHGLQKGSRPYLGQRRCELSKELRAAAPILRSILCQPRCRCMRDVAQRTRRSAERKGEECVVYPILP